MRLLPPDAGQPDARLLDEKRHTQELAALYAVSAAMNQALNEGDALKQALGRVLDVLHLESGKIYLLEPQTGQLTLAVAQGNAELLNPGETAITPGECLCGLAIQTGELHETSDPSSDPRVSGRCRQHAGYACASAPLPAKEGILGILHVASRRADGFSENDMALLRSIGAQIGVAVENMRLREEARRAEALSTLIQEMHHRIKNNLQTVADLLSLEMSTSPSPAARKSLRDSIGRIKSIAAVHELLSLEQLRLTDITELARQVCEISLRQLVRPDQRVTAEINGPAIYLPSKQATALALVMNELIANALEHAFSLNRHDGRLVITLAQDGVQVTVGIADNGRGLPPDFDITGRQGLGLQIVRTLVTKDLAGTLRLENRPEGGSRATLTFYK
ncbi:MAG: GAF domain-containing protein [Chloroflexi bacterium]|nr:GAF domain-containing protein [Chloroflexota bacterium]